VGTLWSRGYFSKTAINLIAPAEAGKTAHAIEHIRARPPLSLVRVLVPSQLQAEAFRQWLANTGNALGVRVGVYDNNLYRKILQASEEVVTRLTDPISFTYCVIPLDDASLVHCVSPPRVRLHPSSARPDL
jgi:hypothetical protein